MATRVQYSHRYQCRGDGSHIGSILCIGIAEERAIALLKDHLSTEQRSQYEQHSYFDVIGGVTGRRYRNPTRHADERPPPR
jgi:hypothetical protein